MSIVYEACVDGVASALEAARGGASRLELCDSLIDGGITPSLGKVRAVVKAVNGVVPIHVLVRPRAGDFLYSAEDFEIMQADIEVLKSEGIQGVVLGILTADGCVDVPRVRHLVHLARPLAVTFHRAIDVAADAMAAFLACRELGIEYVLTSGQAPTALAGARIIASLVALSRESGVGRPCVIAGGGVTPATAKQLVEETGVTQIHGTARVTVDGDMAYRPSPVVYMGGEKHNSPDLEFSHRRTDASIVRASIAAANTAATLI